MGIDGFNFIMRILFINGGIMGVLLFCINITLRAFGDQGRRLLSPCMKTMSRKLKSLADSGET